MPQLIYTQDECDHFIQSDYKQFERLYSSSKIQIIDCKSTDKHPLILVLGIFPKQLDQDGNRVELPLELIEISLIAYISMSSKHTKTSLSSYLQFIREFVIKKA